MINVIKAYSFSEIGGKDNQEDKVYPAPESVQEGQKFFILCDGMGGHEHGEVASETVSSALGHFFEQTPFDGGDIKQYFNTALSYAYDEIDKVDTGGEKKMGTTLTCVYFFEGKVLAAHIGDSRIYQVRNGKILFRTQDHSLVNDLLRAGEITPEEAENYPRKNIITRAIQPNTRRCKADMTILEDVQPGDYFFLCCDGVLEQVKDNLLCECLASGKSDSEKIASIKAMCDKGTRDNYTCWLLPVVDNHPATPLYDAEQVDKKNGGRSTSSILTIAAAFLIGAFVGFYSAKVSYDRKGKPASAQIDTLKQKLDSNAISNTDSITGDSVSESAPSRSDSSSTNTDKI